MQRSESFFQHFRQNDKLPIRLVSPSFGHLAPEEAGRYVPPARSPYYFLLFMLEGRTRHGADLQPFDICHDELFFVLPHQLHQLPATQHGTDYYKLGFDDTCLALLPKYYAFLLNPLNNQKIRFAPAAAARLKAVFDLLLGLLSARDTPPELLLAHLHGLLTEIDTAYFATAKNPADDKLAQYIQFKLLVENTFAEHAPVGAIAGELALSANSLYVLVKRYSGLSPKEFINHRLILEAKRRLYHSASSGKELAYELGFNDPDYFSRLFKKVTGQTVGGFVQDLSGH